MKIFRILVSFVFILAISTRDMYALELSFAQRVLYGSILTVVGAVAAIDGFSQVKVDISNPSYESTGFTWSKRINADRVDTWEADSLGHLVNTGGVDFESITVNVKYYDSANELINTVFSGIKTYGPLKKSQLIDWEILGTRCLYNEPQSPEVKISYEYTPIYELRQKNESVGIVGAIVAVSGIYLLVSSMRDFDEFAKNIRRNNVEVKLTNYNGNIGMLLVKKI